jgi:hypothetical protein
MKDTQTQQCATPSRWRCTPRGKTEVSSRMKRYVSSVRLLTSRQPQVRRGTRFRPLLCYLLPAAPLR